MSRGLVTLFCLGPVSFIVTVVNLVMYENRIDEIRISMSGLSALIPLGVFGAATCLARKILELTC
jgi:hypothetical protein